MDTAHDSTPDTPTPGPRGDLRALDRLVGTWDLSAESAGTVRYEWMDGGHFLLQHVNMSSEGEPAATGVEFIGHWRPYGEEADPMIRSRFYGSSGDTLDYVYEVDGDTLTIWAGDVGSPAYYRGRFSADDRTLDGSWVYPGGGGYHSIATKRD